MFSYASHNSRTTPTDPLPADEKTLARIEELIEGLRPDSVDLLKALHRMQHEWGYVPRVAVPILAGRFQTTPAIVYGTIDFYSEVHLEPPTKDPEELAERRRRGIYGKMSVDMPAENIVGWCSGPACLLKGSVPIRRVLEAVLGCEMNQATPDGKHELRLVQCDGTCHLAPLIRFEGKYIGPLTTSDTVEFARKLKGEPGLEERLATQEETGDESSEEGGE